MFLRHSDLTTFFILNFYVFLLKVSSINFPTSIKACCEPSKIG